MKVGCGPAERKLHRLGSFQTIIGCLFVGFVLPTLAFGQGVPELPRAQANSPSRANKTPVVLTLPDAVLIGLRNNRAIRSEYLQRIADRFALYVAEKAFSPKVNLNAAALRSRSFGTTGTTYVAAPNVTWSLPTGAVLSAGLTNNQNNTSGQTGNAYSQLSFQVIQPLLRGAGAGAAMAGLQVSRLQEKTNKLALAQTVIDTVTQIVLAYRAVIISHEQLHIAEEGLKRANALMETNRSLIAAGRMAQMELVQSQVSIAQQELSLASTRNAYDSSRLALLTLLALDTASDIITVNKLTVIPVKIDETKALQIAYDRQPAYLIQLLASEMGKINLSIAQNQRLWDLSLVAGGGQQAVGTGVYQTYRNFGTNKPDYTVGVQLSVPLFDPAVQQREVNATVGLRQAELHQADLRDRTAQVVRDAVRTVEIQGSVLQTAKRARELSKQQFDIELIKLQAGRSSNFQVVSFQNAFQLAESAELQAIVTYLNSLTTLDQALGTTLDTWKIDVQDQ